MKTLFHRLITALMAVGAAVLALAMLVTFADVILRYFFHSPIKGVYEVIELAMGILSPIAILYCSSRRAHVSVDIVYNMFRPGAQRVLALFSLLCTLLTFIVLAWQGMLLIGEVMADNLTTPTLGLPMWPAALAIGICFLLVVPVTVGEIVHELLGGKRPAHGAKEARP